MIVREFVTEDGLDFLNVQQAQNRSGEHDVALAWNEIKRGVRLRAVLRLINCDGDVELKPLLRLLDPIVELRVTLSIEPIGGLEQVHAQVLGEIGLRPG